MVYYLFKRILYFIPTIILVLFFCFFLLESIPGDPVIDIIHADEYLNTNTQKEYQNTYDGIAKQFNYHLPTFYFSIFPSNRNAAYQEQSVLAKKIKKEWLSEYPENAFNEFNNGFSRIKLQLAQDTSDAAQKSITQIDELTLTALPAVQVAINRITQTIPENYKPTVKSLYNTLVKSRIKIGGFIPSFAWNGFNNRFNIWFINALSGDWGKSKSDGRPVNYKILKAIQWTLYLSLSTVFFAFLLGIPMGLYGALFANTTKEKILSSTLFVLYAVPVFWLATIFIVFFTTDEYGQWTNIFPSAGIYIGGKNQSIFSVFLSHFSQMVLPILCHTLSSIAYVYRQMRSNSLDELVKPYALTARAKGLSRNYILKTHIARNSIYPLIGLLATIIPGLIAGSLIVEILFNIPGMGRLMLDAISTKDWNVILGIIITTSIFTFIGFLIADILLYLVNPKVKYA